ncbi:MAG: sugar ABC transporter ATP-binding protein [Lentisphaerota bacterium]
MDELLRLENISKTFPGVCALKNVSFTLRKGEVHALLGENGAGKSTFIKIVSGAQLPDKKTDNVFLINGSPANIHTPHQAIKIGISTVYQELNLCPHLSVAENIFLNREVLSFPRRVNYKKMYEETTKLLDYLQVNINPRTRVKDLPVSKQQIIEIAKALSYNATILIMDEPTSSLSENEVADLHRIILQLKKEGKGIIYISHKLEELNKIVDRITVFRDGEYIVTADFNSITLDEIIKHMVGRSVDEKYPKLHLEPSADALFSVRNLSNPSMFKDLSFDLYKGEILGFAGLVGAGRTEFAKTVFGAFGSGYKGEIFINGKPIKVSTPSDAISHGLVYIPEDRKHEGLALGMTIEQNLTIPNTRKLSNVLGILRKNAMRDYAKNISNTLKIKTPSIKQLVKNLSGGNQQKVVIGKWIARKPFVMIFDEPTRGVDVNAKVEIYKILNNLKEQGIGVIMISSDLPELLGMTDRLAVMRRGKLIKILKTKETNQEEVITYAAVEK